MHALDQSLIQLLTALGDLTVALAQVLLPFLPLVIWAAFWMFAVNWTKLRSILFEGGWIGLVLIGLVAILVWGTVAPPASGSHHFLGLTVGNFVGKTVLVTTLICIMLLCGSVQLSGACGRLCRFEEPAPEPAHDRSHAAAGGHQHDEHHH